MAENDVACDDAMRLLEAIATIIDGPIADTRLHDWSGLPERVRLKVHSWQPIATAPKDETAVLICRISIVPGYRPVVARWSDLLSPCSASWTDGEYTFSPTHWMPLPAPPDAEEPR
jgi:hypothetical protein